MSTLIFFSRPGITGLHGASLVKQSSVINSLDDQVMFLTHANSNWYFKELHGAAHISPKIVSYRTQLFRDVLWLNYAARDSGNFHPQKSWYDAVMKGFDEVFSDVIDDIDKVVLFGGAVAPYVNRDNNALNSAYETNKLFAFHAVARIILGTYLAIHVANVRGIPIHEVCFDPDENSVAQLDIVKNDVTTYHSYDSDRFGLTRLDSLQYYLMNYVPRVTCEKDLRVVFGGCITAQKRVKYWEKLQPFVNTFGSHDRLHMRITKPVKVPETEITHTEYLQTLSRARFTVVIPAYNIEAFSGYRFIEAVYNRCLPFIAEDCAYDEFAKSYGIESSVLDKLVVPYDGLSSAVDQMREGERCELLDYLYDKVIRFERGFV